MHPDVRIPALVVAPGGVLDGIILRSGDVRVGGRVRGDIVLTEGRLYIEDGGEVDGDVVADGIHVAGRVRGLCAADHVLIMPCGELHGIAHAAALTIEPGGRLVGGSRRRDACRGFRFAPVAAPAASSVLLLETTAPASGTPVRRRLMPRLVSLLLAAALLWLCHAGWHKGRAGDSPAPAPAVSMPPHAAPPVAPSRWLAPPAAVARKLPAVAVYPAHPRPVAAGQPVASTPLPSTVNPVPPVSRRGAARSVPKPAPMPQEIVARSAPLAAALHAPGRIASPGAREVDTAVSGVPSPAEVDWLAALAGLQSDMLNQAILQNGRPRAGAAARQHNRSVAVLADNLVTTRKLLRKYGGSQAVSPYVLSLTAPRSVATGGDDENALKRRYQTLRERAGQIGLHAESKQLLDRVSTQFDEGK
jgi:cytoskeletal protein CcmA (bactofilin family)